MSTVWGFDAVDYWTELARRMRMSRSYVKIVAYRLLYGGGDPADWHDHIFWTEMQSMLREPSWQNRP